MKFSRRQFIGLTMGIGLSSCTRVRELNWAQLKPEISLPHWGDEGPLCFVAMNDLHVLDAKSTGIINRAINQINADSEVQFVVLLGDLATQGRIQELKLVQQSLERLEKPYFCVPGNHDVAVRATDMYANYIQTCGNTQWREGEGGWAFLGLDTCNGSASDVTVPSKRMKWIKKQLEHIGPKRSIALFSHHPFNPHTKAYRVKNAEAVLSLFEGYNLKLVASGHYHGNQVEERDGVLFTTTACCSSTRDNFDKTPEKGYRRFQLDNETVQHTFVEVTVYKNLLAASH